MTIILSNHLYQRFLGTFAVKLILRIQLNQIKKGLLLSQRVKKILKSVNIWQSYKQERDCLMHFLRLLPVCCPGALSVWDNHAVTCNLCQVFTDFNNFFSHTLSNKPFLICLLTTPPYLKYVAILPCNLSLMACFADINVSQGSVATCARCNGIFNIHLTANLLWNLSVKFFLIGQVLTELWPWACGPTFLPTLYMLNVFY